MATPGLLKIIVFWNKSYDVIISVDDVTNKILSRDLNCIADGFMWPKFGIWVFPWEKLWQPKFYKDLTRKTAFLEGWSLFKFNNLGLVLRTNLKFYTSVAKELTLKARKFLGLIPTLVEVSGGKLIGGGGGLFAPHPE